MSKLNRREFVILTAACACSAALAESPGGQRQPASQPGGKPVDLGLLKQFDKDLVYDKWKQTNRFLIVRHEGRLYAVSSRCTHKGGMLKFNATQPDQLVCPMHGSKFDLRGVPVSGPAKAPLFRMGIRLTDQQHVIVDPSQQFSEADWDKPEAFVEVKA